MPEKNTKKDKTLAPKRTKKAVQGKAQPEETKAKSTKGAKNERTKRAPAKKAAAGKKKLQKAAKNIAAEAVEAIEKKVKPGKLLKVIPLGGVGEIGKNMTVLEYDDEIIVIDCGMTFPDDELLGVDMVIPDTTYLQKNADKVKGVFITHAHEDHIGGLPYFLRNFNVPIHCTALTEGLVSLRLTEHKNLRDVRFNVHKAGDTVKLGCFSVEFIHVNHSVPDACALAIKTPVGMVLFTGDFKIDTSPVDGAMIDLVRLGELGKKGVELLMMDSTNADRAGIAMSEKRVSDSFEREFKDCKKRIIVASFASNVHRIQKIIEIAAKHNRKVAVSGRSMENIIKVGSELGYIRPDKNRMIELGQIKKYPDDQLVIITTGSQGESMSALYRMAYSSHRQVDVGPGDKILIAASPIPGNEKSVYHMINELIRKGAEVVYERLADIHVSGHACQEELKLMLSLIKPKFFMPVHGEYRHLKCNAALAQQTGMDSEHIFLTDLGKVLELGQGKARWGGTVPSGRVLIDGYGVGDVGTSVLRERRLIGQDGVIVASAAVDMFERRIISEPFIVSRGFIFVKEAEDLITEMEEVTRDALNFALSRKEVGLKAVKDAVSDKLSDFLYKKTKRSPVIVPIITEID